MAISLASVTPPAATTAELLARARLGSPDALGALYSQFGGTLFRLAYRLSGSREDAEDTVHDVFVALPDALEQYQERGRFEPWVKRITARVALSRRRRGNRRGEVPLLEAQSSQDQALDADVIALRTAVEALPDPLRAVLVLKEMEGYSHAEIADILGISTVTSRVRLLRGMSRLRRILGGTR